ncbi:PKD-like family lipoprotein [Prevotella sp. E13-17]|uniref:PKD-like family lipoprotein n=1 Tax=Prevotella sp. E13-17 TaxID=2913616 RepID=UPI001EDA7686|nr:PKD-like family lipoprotein [Prevotella sp. E13-17]UKK50876.1 PKD-like family lipoprotein [Prevotella sp. E13-17]
MMKRYFSIVLSVMAAMLSLVSCYEDKGNYDYRDLDVVTIDTMETGMQSAYSLMRFDRLRLAPHIFFNGQLVDDSQEVPLDYQWTIFSSVSGTGANSVIDTIGNQRVLDTVISRTAGSYLVQLVVKNRHTDVCQFFRVPVSVSEVLDGGWMVFYERADHPGTSDLALIHNPWTKNNVVYDRIYSNLYETTNGELLDGKPVRCLDIAVSLAAGNNYIGLCTDRTLVGVSENGFEKALMFKDFFHEAPSTEAPIWYGEHGSGVMSGQSSEVLINENQVYTNTYVFSAADGRTTRFGVAKFGDEIGQLAPWNAEVPNTLNYGIIVYDQTNHRFRYSAYNGARLEYFGDQDMEQAAFDINNTGMELLLADWGRGSSQGNGLRPYEYLLMGKGQQRYLAVANFSSSAPTDPAIGLALYPLDAICPQIDHATTFAASHVGSFVYYGAGRAVYNLAYDSGLPATEAWRAPSADEEVTCVRIMKYYHGTIYGLGRVPQSDNLVHIATWNEKTQEGHVYQYLINPASGILDTDNHYEYVVPGRVKDMAWKFTLQ